MLHTHKLLTHSATALAALLYCCSGYAAAPVAERAPLSLGDAIARTLANSPELAGFRLRELAQAARLRQAQLRPAPELSLQVEDALGSGSLQGFGSAQTTLALSQVIELGPLRERRAEVATAALEATRIEQQSAELDQLAEVTRRYIHLVGDQQELELSKLAAELAQRTVDEVERRVEAARTPAAELSRAQVTLTRAEIALEHAEHELETSRRRLAAMWGDRQASFGVATAELLQLPQPLSFEQLAADLQRSPELLRFASESRLRAAETRLAEARARPSPTWSAGVRRLEQLGDTALVAGVSVPLFSRARAAPAIDEARARERLVDTDRAAAALRIETRLFELYQELVHAIAEASTLRDSALPRMEAALEQTRYAWERGRYGYLELAEAQTERIAVQRALIAAAVSAHELLCELERLTNAPLSATNSGEPR